MNQIFHIIQPKSALPFTGERLTSTVPGSQVEVEHLHRYLAALKCCYEKDVLDIASGEGYGAKLLSLVARSVVGVELASGVVEHATRNYADENLRYVAGDARAIPLADASVDVVVSFETIEHIREQEAFIAEVRRVLRPDGMFIVSTPDREIYSPLDSAANPYHVRELTKAEFLNSLRAVFPNVACFHQRTMMGSALVPDAPDGSAEITTFERRGPSAIEMNGGLPRAMYLVAIASAATLPRLAASLFIETTQFGLMLGELADLRQRVQGMIQETRDLRDEIGRMEARATNAEEQWRLAVDEIGRMEARATNAEEQWRLAVAEVQRLADAVAGHVQAVAEAGLKADRAAADASRLRSEVGTVRQRLDDLTHATVAESGRAKTAVDSLQRKLEDVHAQLAHSEEQARIANNWLEAVRNSTSWKALAVARHAGRRFPFVARVVRSGVRGTWRLLRPALIRRPSPLPAEPEPLAPTETATAALPDVPVGIEDPTNAERGPKERFEQTMQEALRGFLRGAERITFARVTEPDISVLLVLYNQAHFTLQCLQALTLQTGVSIELVIVDNGSSDATDALLCRVDHAKVLRNAQNEGFLLAVNRAAAVATGQHLLLLNSDAFVRDGALATALATLKSAEDIGVVGCRIVLPTGTLQEAGSIVFNDGSTLGYARGLRQDAGEAMFRRDVHFCSGAFLLTPRALFNELDYLDTRYVPAYYEEADYCERVRAHGKRVVYEPQAVIDHFEFGSQQKVGEAVELQLRNRRIFRDRHHAALAATRLPPMASNVLFARDAAPGRRRLLFIDRQVPLQALGSGFPRARAMLAEIVDAGWFVSFYPTFETEVDWDAAYREVPREVEICDRRGHEGLAAFLAERRSFYDTILISRPENMRFLQAIRNEKPHLVAGLRLIYDAEALFSAREITRARLEGHVVDRATADALTREELTLCEGTDAVITVTPLEQAVFSAGQGAPVHVLSYPVATPTHATPGFEHRHGFLFVGRLMEKETPNYDGLRWFIADVWPRIRARLPNAELQVAGMLAESHDELEAPGVHLFGGVADLRPLYDSARVFLAPTRYAAGVPIKVLEAVGASIPVACTPLIANQLGWKPGCEIAVADDPNDFADAAVAVHESPELWRSMVDAATRRIAIEHGRNVFHDGIRALIGNGSSLALGQEMRGEYYDPERPEVSVIVLNWNKSAMTLQCVRHLHRYTAGFPFEIIVVDNGSRPEQVAILAEATVPFRLVRLAHNRYFGEPNNIAAEAARGAFICFINNDAFVQPGWLAPLMDALRTQPRAGGAGSKLVYPDGRMQEAGAMIAEDGLAIQLGKGGSSSDPEFNRLRAVDYSSAATFLMRRDVFLRVLGFDLCWEPAYYEDVDLCLKIAALGLTIYYVPQSVVIHVESATSLDPMTGLRLDNIVEINRRKLVARWGKRLVDRTSVPGGLLPDTDGFSSPLYCPHGGPHGRHRIALYTPYHLTPGGGERHLLSIAVALADHAHVTLVTPDLVSRIRVLTIGRELGLELSALALATAAEIERAEFDVAFVIGNEVLPSIPGPATRNIYICQFPFPMPEAELWRRRALWPRYEAVWVYSPFVERHVRARMQSGGIAKKPIEIVAPPVTMHRCHDLKQPKIVNVGRFFTGWHCKRQDLMIEAFARLVREGATDAELHLAGSLHPEPENRAYLASLMEAAKGLPVFFHINCSKEELAFLYADCRIYWHATGLGVDVDQMPEKAEHFGITIVEAMSAGCVPIVHAAGGPMELVDHGRTGYLFRSIEELCALTRPILADPNAAEVCAMAAAACRSARAYSDTRFAEMVRARAIAMLPSPANAGE